jgi:hypothetical protein
MAKGKPEGRGRAKWPKMFADLFVEAERQGWTIGYTKGGHFRLRGPKDPKTGKRAGLVFTGATPGHPSARRRTLDELRRQGFRWTGR